ncbi:MAG: hypothetical protein WD990_05330 [Acidimicrobiia bacterium]
MSDRALTVSADGELLGSYPLEDVAVARVGSDRFDLHVGTDQLVFTADDAIRFSYEAMPLIETSRTQLLGDPVARFRSWWKTRITEGEGAGERPTSAEMPAGKAFTPSETRVSLSAMRQRLDESAAGSVSETAVAVEDLPRRIARSMSSDLFAADASKNPAGFDEPEVSTAVASCMGIRSDGKICGSAAVSPRGFCYAHDPDRHVERREVHEQTTKAADRVRRSATENLDDVVARLERAVAEVHEGRLDPQQALAMASLAQAMVDTIELAKSQEAEKRAT